MADKLDMMSMDVTQANIAKIRELFPSVVTEVQNDGKTTLAVDFDLLKEELSSAIMDGKQERYQMTWPDKRKAKMLASSKISATLRPDKAKSVDFDNTQNVYIEGDNLDVLKLLRETYLGQIKMIYIDPPYNTGNDFVYEDDFSQSAEEYAQRNGEYDEQGNRLVVNPESNGRYHTDWLNMIYPRLKVAKDLLSNEGIICISIDDNEVDNLIKICDEIFGPNNHIGLITLMSNPRGSQNGKYLSYVHEYILIYARNINEVEICGIAKSEESLGEYRETDMNGRKYRLLGLRKRGGAWRKEDRPNMFYPIYIDPTSGECSLEASTKYNIEVIPKRPTGELSRWTWGKEKFIADRELLIGKQVARNNLDDAWDVFRKDYVDDENGEERTTKVKTIWVEKDVNYQNAKNEIRELFGDSEIFDYPKPTFIIEKLIEMLQMEEGDIVLDFFSGSATTAQALMQVNSKSRVQRHFILIQCAELCSEKSRGYKAGYKTICDIGEERIRRAGKQIVEEKAHLTNAYKSGALQLEMAFAEFTNSEQAKETQEKIKKHLDIGFRVFKLDSSNMQEVYYNPNAMAQDLLESTVDNIKPDRTPLDLLFQVMLDLGKPLSSKIEEQHIEGKTVYLVNGNDLIACFDDDITNEVITAIAKQQPLYAVFKDKSFANDSVAINNEQLFKTYSPSTTIKVL